MASIARDPNGRKRIQWLADDGTRQTVRLKCDVKQAESLRAKVEALIAARITDTPWDAELAGWVRDLPDKLHAQLSRAGLVPSRESVRMTLAGLLDRFIAAKSVKPATAAVYSRVRRSLENHFGADRALSSITVEDAERWRKSLADAGLARATQSKLTHVVKQIFARAVKWSHLSASPFADLKPGPQDNPARKAFISREDLAAILAACPSAEWRCIFAMARLAGLRCPSEVLGLEWRDVDWEGNRLTVRSPKTEHHAGGGMRLVPMVPDLRTVLLDAFHAAEPGAVLVIDRGAGANLRTQATRIVERARVKPWPKLFVNLRASCATEWARDFPGHVAASWLGHSPAVAARHYLQVRPEDFARASLGAPHGAPGAQNPAQQPPATSRNDPKAEPKEPEFAGVLHDSAEGCEGLQNEQVGATGLEPVTSAM